MERSVTRHLVVSAVNFSEGGPLTILRECLQAARASLPVEWEITAIVHDRRLIDIQGVRLLEFPDSKRSWLRRLYYEFWHFERLSKQLRPDVWFSLHDISPRVVAGRRVVYCHNASPFSRMPLRNLPLDPTQFLFTLFYGYLYRINIHKNDLIIVQQDWMRQAFRRLYGVKNVAVAYPICAALPVQEASTDSRCDVFLYPSLPRVSKNFEVLCEAAELLRQKVGASFEVRLTVAGQENPYAARLYRRYGASLVVKFIGRQSPAEMAAQYRQAGTVVFPSLLESWGLPISEGKMWRKTLLLADLPYAHEALGSYDCAAFFDPYDPAALAHLMAEVLDGKPRVQPHSIPPVAGPFAADWESLLRLVIGESFQTVQP